MKILKRELSFSRRSRRKNRSTVQEEFENALESENITLAQNILINNKDEIDLDVLDSQGVSPLHRCVLLNNTNLLRVLISFDADINTTDKNGWTSLHAASALGHEQTARILLMKGIDFTAQSVTGESAIDVSTSPKVSRLIKRHSSKRSRLLSREGTFDSIDSNNLSCSASTTSGQSSSSSNRSNYSF